VRPDIVVLAKGMASGFPIAAIGAGHELMARWPVGAHGGTYGGNPVGCAAAIATIDVIEREALVGNAAARGAQLVDALGKVQADHPAVGDVRGLGLMVAIELVDGSGAPDAARTGAVVAHCLREHQVIFMTAGSDGNVVRFMPPLIVDAQQIDRAVAAVADALTATAR
jgi:4-aminobutyrate aminotransferase-like enzyme